MRGGDDGAWGHPHTAYLLCSLPVPSGSCQPVNIFVNVMARQLEEICWKGMCNSLSKMWRGPIHGTIHGLGVICCKYFLDIVLLQFVSLSAKFWVWWWKVWHNFLKRMASPTVPPMPYWMSRCTVSLTCFYVIVTLQSDCGHGLEW